MTITVPFLMAVALAGLGAMAGKLILRTFPALIDYIPQPLLGGILVATVIFLVRLFHVVVDLPTKGHEVDFLIALLTTNMGLHITPKIFRHGTPIFFLFLGAGVVLFFCQLLANLPVAYLSGQSLQTALVSGPLSFVGAPYNLNPPDQTKPILHLFTSYPELKSTAQGTMMIGVLAAVFLGGWLSKHLLRKSKVQPPKESFDESSKKILLTRFSDSLTALLVLVLSLISISFLLQTLLLHLFPALQQDYAPVIVISFLLGGCIRLAYPFLPIRKPFPEQALTVLLIGPTMNLVLTYAVMSIPLHLIIQISPTLLIGGVLSVLVSLGFSMLLFPLVKRLTNDYYAAVIATAFFVLTTGWGPVAMSYLRRFVHTEGDVEPMPVIMPLNAFYIFPWMVIFLIRLLL